MWSPARGNLSFRRYRDEDEPGVLALMTATRGPGQSGKRSSRFFRWKHMENPFGQSLMLVAESGGRIVGLRAFMRWRLRSGDRALVAARAVDAATDPSFQRRGIFTSLTRDALEILRDEADLLFNTPNEKSLAGNLKLGWREVGRMPVALRVRRPFGFAAGAGSRRGEGSPRRHRPEIGAPPAAEVLSRAEGLPALVEQSRNVDGRLETDRSLEYLRWRYASAPDLDYRAVVEWDGDRLRGLALFRVRPRGRLWEATISEVLVREGDRAAAGRLLGRATKAAAVDHLTAAFPPGHFVSAAARRRGFVRAPGGMLLIAQNLGEDLPVDVTDRLAWSLTLGDLEVF